MERQGKCENYANCLLAYRNETITITEGEFVCPECKQPLVPLAAATKAAPKMIPTLIVGGILALLLMGGIGVWMQARRLTSTPPPAPEVAAQRALENQGALKPSRDETASAPAASTSPAPEDAETAPAQVSAPAKPDLDVTKVENAKVKTEVLRRIDLMPTISEENKDKLYVSVERARQMGRVLIIPFGKGKTDLTAKDADDIKSELASPQLQQIMQDPTCVFVILGFADTKGDEKTNLRISEERGKNTLKTLREKCGVINVMHAVGMGGSNLLDENGAEKNRASEIWAVLP